MDVKTITFLSGEEPIRGHLLLPHTLETPQPAIIKCHGLPGSPNQVSGIATELVGAGFLVLTFNFRGIRQSDGQFSYANAITDTGNAISFLEDSEFVNKNQIALYGASFGGAVAISRAAIDLRIRCVAVRAPIYDTELFFQKLEQKYSSESIFSELSKEVRGLNREDSLRQFKEDVKRYNPMELVDHITPRAFLVVAGDKDKVIEVEGVKRLFNRAKEPKKLEIVTGADHKLSSPETFQKTNQIVVTWFRDILGVL